MDRQRVITNYLDLSGRTKNHHNLTFAFCSLENDSDYDLHFKNKKHMLKLNLFILMIPLISYVALILATEVDCPKNFTQSRGDN